MKTNFKKLCINSFSVLLALTMMITTLIAMPTVNATENNDNSTNFKVSINSENKEITLTQGMHKTIEATCSEKSDKYKYQWQILADEENDIWVNVTDANKNKLELSYSLIASAQNSSGVTFVRCKVTEDKTSQYSDKLKVTTSFVPNDSKSNNTSDKNISTKKSKIKRVSSASSSDIVNITINYLDGVTGNKIYSPYNAQVEVGTDFNQSIISPTYLGYKAYYNKDNPSINIPTDGTELVANDDATVLKLTYDKIDSDKIINVYYKAIDVPYSVSYYFQNIYDNYYTQDTALTYKAYAKTGEILSDDVLNEPVKDKVGFSPVYHIPVSVAGDGSTTINNYFDRNYYLIKFDLDGGYGTDPIYARYQTSLVVNTPTKAGYTFKGWELVSSSKVENNNTVTEDKTTDPDKYGNGIATSTPNSMPAENLTYRAMWESNDTEFTVVYWQQNNDDTSEYEYWGSETHSCKSATVVDGNDYKELPTSITNSEGTNIQHFHFKKADSKVTVKGDGSTVVNVYYDRNKYTLRYIYARKDLTTSKVYVKGGSTYNFGSGRGSIKDISDPSCLEDGSFVNYLLNRDANDWPKAWGEVKELPQIKSDFLNKTDSDGNKIYKLGSYNVWLNYYKKNFEYYYLEFTGHYGQFIGNIWPTDPFEKVQLTDEEIDKGKNNGKAKKYPNSSDVITDAYFAGWNGEHFVKYSYANNGNQTIKGNYRRLDKNILLDLDVLQKFYPNEKDHTIVNYLGYFNNGSNEESWNVPRRWTYECYTPSLNNQKTDYLYNGTYYDLKATSQLYDDCTTVYNASKKVMNETPTALRGFTYSTYEQPEMYICTDPSDEAYRLDCYTAKFYYKRNSYKLRYYNYDKYVNEVNGSGGTSVYYETDISKGNFTPEYPSSLEKNAYEFGGWYTSPDCYTGSEVDWTDLKMPANDLTLYAKWVPKEHTVRVFKNYSYRDKLAKAKVLAHTSVIDKLDNIAHTESPETNSVWEELLDNATPNEKGVYTVTLNNAKREYVKENGNYYRLGRFNNALFTLNNNGTEEKYLYLDDSTRKGYVKADGLLEVRFQGHGYTIENIDTPSDEETSEYIFEGWKAIKSETTSAYSPHDTPITDDTDVYADWGSQKSSPYLVHFALNSIVDSTTEKNISAQYPNPEENQTVTIDSNRYIYLADDSAWHLLIADDYKGYRFEGTTCTITPKVGNPGNQLYDGYNQGYYPTLASHTIILQKDDSDDIKNNVYTFTYAHVPSVNYTVEYRYNEPGTPLVSDSTYPNTDTSGLYGKKEVTTSSSVVTEKYQTIPNYVPDDTYKRMILSVEDDGNGNFVSSSNNIIVFKYTKSENSAPYIIHYMLQKENTTGTNYAVNGTGDYTESTGSVVKGNATIGDLTVTPIEFDGFTLVNNKAVVVDSSTGNESDATVVEGNKFSFKVAENCNELYIFYTRNKTSYKVYYLKYGTDVTHIEDLVYDGSDNGVLADIKEVSDCEYNSTVTETAKEIKGMTYANKELSIKLSQNPSLNTIVFFYTPLQYTVEYKPWKDGTGTVSKGAETVNGNESTIFDGSTAKATEGHKFVGWYIDKECTTLVSEASPKLADVNGNTITPIVDNLTPNNKDGHTSTVFYAKFTPLNGYSVKYDLNGGNINGSTTVPDKTNLTWDTDNLTTTDIPTKQGYGFTGWTYESTKVTETTTYGELAKDDETMSITLVANWTPSKVYFHSNLDGKSTSETKDIFRTYCTDGGDDHYTLNTNGTIDSFYDIPSYDNNKMIFAGWYYEDGKAYNWNDTLTGEVHLYAHWISVNTVEKTSDDTKVFSNGLTSYNEFDLFGVQIRNAKKDDNYPGGSSSTPAFDETGLRFVTSVSENILSQIDNLSSSKPEYGYIIAKTDTAKKYASGNNYKIQYNGKNVNGVDTTESYKYIKNINCTSKVGGYGNTVPLDHFNNKSETYRIYTAVITYKNNGTLTDEQIQQAKSSNVLARSYIRYTDANGLLRTHYNDYTGTNAYGGCSTNFNYVNSFIQNNYNIVSK